jgi:methyl-accepting chemotaxis protein
MSTERWDDDRLDRLADRVENIASIAESNSRAIENNARLIESNARVIQALANVAAEAREERQQILQLIAQQQASIDRHQANIEGLRTETVRMLDILLNQRDRGDNPTT